MEHAAVRFCRGVQINEDDRDKLNNMTASQNINEIQCVAVRKIDNDVNYLKAISKKRGIPIEMVARMLRYNVLTPTQLASLTAKTEMAVRGLLQPGSKKGRPIPAKLTRCYIHQEWEWTDEEKKHGVPKEGRLLILRDEKCEELIRESNSILSK